MSPSETLLKEKSDYLRFVKCETIPDVRIVEVIEDKSDDMYCPDWVRRALLLLPITAAAAVWSGSRYWKLQFGQLLMLRSLGMNVNIRLVFALIDLLLNAPLALKAVMDSVSMLTPTKKRPNLRLLGNNVPTVDIIITTCREPTDVCLDTVLAAIHVDYPKDRFRVIVTDDGANEDLRKGIIELAKSNLGSRLFYTSRTKGRHDRHKAANLNHALAFASMLPGGASEFAAGLDADMIPLCELLRAQIPHMLLDDRLSMTCPAANFYNVPLSDPLLQSQTVHNKWEEFSRDRLDHAWCTGSGYVMRRAALDQLGGFPMETIGEDVFCSTGLLNLGWKTAFLDMSLQYGLVPDTYHSHLKQFRRWKLSGDVLGVDKNFGFYGKNVKGLSFFQRVFWFYCPFRTMTDILMVILFFTGPLFILSGISPIVYATKQDLKALAQASAVSFICSFLLKCHMGLKTGYRAIMLDQCMEIWMAPYHAVSQLKTYVLPTWLGGTGLTFISTGSIPNQLHERDAEKRASLYNRLRSIVFRDGAWFHVFFATTTLLGVASVVMRAHQKFPSTSQTAEFTEYLFTRLGWLPLSWVFTFFGCVTPLVYAVFPPTVPDREELLVRDARTGAPSPKQSARGVHWAPSYVPGFQHLHILVVAYALWILHWTSQW